LTSETISKHIEELQHTVTVSALNYDIWWVYKGKDTRPKYVEVFNYYPLFFQTSLHAHFVALLMGLYRLYETRKDSHNIPQLIRELEADGTLEQKVLNKFCSDYEQLKPLWVKVSILRNKGFGHRNSSMDTSDVFKEANLAPNDLRDLIEGTKELMNDITLAWDNSFHAFNLGSKDDLIRMLDHLNVDDDAT